MNAAPKGKNGLFFVHEAKTFRVRSGTKVRELERLTGLSRATVGRIEGNVGISEVNAWAYLRALKKISPEYPYSSPFNRPYGSKER